MEQQYQELLETYKKKSLEEYEKHAAELSESLKEKDFRFKYDSFVPYPPRDEKRFNEIIYKKQEFFRNKSRWDPNEDYDSVANDKCLGEFRITPNQKFLKNFMSPMTPYRSLLVYHSVGVGKCHAEGTPILMHDGSVKPVECVRVGDLLMGDDSKPRRVLSLGQGEDEMYDIEQSIGETYRVNSEHILVLRDARGAELEIEVRDYVRMPASWRSRWRGYSTFVQFPERETPECPFTAGVKFDGEIDECYLRNSVENRLKYLLGVASKRGRIDGDRWDIRAASPCLTYLARSLGFAAVELDKSRTRLYRIADSRLRVRPAGRGRYYGFTLDGNHRYLLGGFTVTHNTCTAINIAEQYYDTFEKRVLVVLSGNIEDNFRKQIFDINKVNQCTGTKYPDMVLDKHLLSKDLLDKKINSIIKQRYEFVGYKELAFYIKNKKAAVRQQIRDPNQDPNKEDASKLPENIRLKRKQVFEEIIRERFSDRLIIIDEAHNLRMPDESGSKQISVAFLEMLQIVENVKLILMTATPMYNTADEIVWLMNLMLTNDREKTISRSALFDKDNKLKAEGESILREIARGRVSYMRGENPYSFPFRLFPSSNDAKDAHILTSYPSKDIYGEPIEESDRVKHLEIIASEMSEYQQNVYNLYKSEDAEDDDDLKDEKAENTSQSTMQISNVVYPTEHWKSDAKEKKEGRKTYGNSAFKSCFDATVNMSKVRYNKHVKEKYGEFLSYSKLAQYAPKIKTIIDYIKNARGIVFVHSRFYGAGLYPLICALEQAGMSRFSHDGKQRRFLEDARVEDQFAGKMPKFIVISPKKEISPDNDREIELAKSKENLNGELIKVIVVSKVGTEGIDFKRIREVHILEPWYNLNRAEQTIGRAVRTCSHIDLPREHRNVTIYFHASVCRGSDADRESSDLRAYRISETKQKKIIEVERVLKEMSIDCNLNKQALMFPVDRMKLSFDIVTAQGKTIKKYAVGDRDGSFICGFKPCEFSCKPNLPETLDAVDNSTFDIEFVTDEIQMMRRYVASIYAADAKPRTHAEVLSDLRKNYKMIEEEIVSFALEEMVAKKAIFKAPKGSAYLIYRGDKYILQYEAIHDARMPLDERREIERKRASKRLELDLSRALRAAPAAALASAPGASAEASPARSADDIYDSLYDAFASFVVDLETGDEEAAGELKSYLAKAKQSTRLERVAADFAKKRLKDVSAAASTSRPACLAASERLVERYEDHLIDATLDRLDVETLHKVATAPKTDVERRLKKAIEGSDFIVGNYYVSAADKSLYKLQRGKVVKCGPTDLLLVEDAYSKLKAKVSKKPESSKRMFTMWQKGKLVFKIRDSGATSGAVCDTSPKKAELLDKIAKCLGKSGAGEMRVDYKKSSLCVVLEILNRKSPAFERALYLE